MVNTDGSTSLEATIKGNMYKVIHTKNGSSDSVWDAVDKIKNLTTGQVQEKTRKQWKKTFDRWN